jgi:hypothetical protein
MIRHKFAVLKIDSKATQTYSAGLTHGCSDCNPICSYKLMHVVASTNIYRSCLRLCQKKLLLQLGKPLKLRKLIACLFRIFTWQLSHFKCMQAAFNFSRQSFDIAPDGYRPMNMEAQTYMAGLCWQRPTQFSHNHEIRNQNYGVRS